MRTPEGRVVDEAVHENLELNRRRLLREAGNRVALATGGLLLPAGLYPNGTAALGELGGRHGKNRRGRDQAKRRKRSNTREKRREQPPGWSFIKYVSFEMQAAGSLQGVRVDTYYRIKGEGEHWSSFKPAQSFTNLENTPTYAPERYSIAAFIQAHNATPLFIEARNPLIGTPWVSVTRGGRIDGSGNYVDGSYRWGVGYFAFDYLNEPQNVNQPQRFTMSPDQDNVPPVAVTIITRKEDTDSHKVFLLYIRSGWTEDACNVNTNCYPQARGVTGGQFPGSRTTGREEDVMTNQPKARDGVEAEVPQVLARRSFIRSTAGGLLVSAAGLWLPDKDEEAQARDGAFGGNLGGRRGKNRRGRERRDRKHDRDRKPSAPPRPPGAADPLLIQVDFTNLRNTPVTIDAWEAGFQDWDNWIQTNASWKQVSVPAAPAIGQPPVKSYIGNQPNMAVAIAPDRVLYIETDSLGAAANVAILTGTWSASGRNPITGVLAVKMDMPVGFVMYYSGVRVKRLANGQNLVGEDIRAVYAVSSI